MENKIIWVYGTLKRSKGNYSVMERAKGEYIGEDYIGFDKVWDCGFPQVKLSAESNKYLLVELFEVPEVGVEWPLDGLEGYNANSPYNHYNRVKTTTFLWKEIEVYEIVSEPIDCSENYFSHIEWDNLFYNRK